ncbi:MAG TPA: ferritin-like domain-containing protein [Rhizomicrobium sp.]|nr:ferritin-like domain-containing protein [Rhizomicrobium sp.]
MAEGTVFKAGWTLDDVRWQAFDAAKVDPGLLASVKAASLVEYNAPDYVIYLRKVFDGGDQRTLDAIDRWGVEETQHGLALARWAEMADPAFNFKEAFARFRAGYRPEHFSNDDKVSVRGSRRGEMIARCVVECGTSSFYSAIRDAADEPVLKEVAGRIAADEFRHYKLFYEILHQQDEAELPFWKKLMVALSRVNEADDDELAYAYYAANIPPTAPYKRDEYAKAYNAKAFSLYQRHHIRKLVQMVAKAVGADPNSRLTSAAGMLAWRMIRMKAGLTKVPARAAA